LPCSSRNPLNTWERLFTLLRLYSPKESFFDKTWRLTEIELVK
jgi:hypothetical protein